MQRHQERMPSWSTGNWADVAVKTFHQLATLPVMKDGSSTRRTAPAFQPTARTHATLSTKAHSLWKMALTAQLWIWKKDQVQLPSPPPPSLLQLHLFSETETNRS